MNILHLIFGQSILGLSVRSRRCNISTSSGYGKPPDQKIEISYYYLNQPLLNHIHVSPMYARCMQYVLT